MPTRTKPIDVDTPRVKESSAKKRAPSKGASVTRSAPKQATASRKPSVTKGLTMTATDAPTRAFFASLDAATRADCERIDAWMRSATGAAGVMYGRGIVGYGTSTIRYADGREAPWLKIGFSPRSQALSLYGILTGASPALLSKLGKHDTGKGCLYIKRLSDVDSDALQRIIVAAARA